jgi:hypothetical protein
LAVAVVVEKAQIAQEVAMAVLVAARLLARLVAKVLGLLIRVLMVQVATVLAGAVVVVQVKQDLLVRRVLTVVTAARA